MRTPRRGEFLLRILRKILKMFRSIGTCLVFLCYTIKLFALEGVVSHTVFYLPDPSHANKLTPSAEVYWQINPHSVHYTTTPEKTIVARIMTDVTFTSEKGGIKEDRFILQTVPSADINELMTHNIIDLRRYFVTPGFTRMKIRFTDMADTAHPLVFTDTFTVPSVTGGPFYSDLQLLDTTIESPDQTVFKKNGRQQVPACINFLDESRGILHYYAELYQAGTVSTANYPLVQKVFVSKNENDPPVEELIRKDTVIPRQVNFVSGDYHLNVTLENNARITIASATLFFQRLNIHPVRTDTLKKVTVMADTGMEHVNVLNLEKTFLSKYNIPQTHAMLKMLLPVADPVGVQAINGFLKKPNDLYIRYFIYNYFLNINKNDPAKAWKEYADKIKEVNKMFSEHGTPGYETERGFIYLRYGAPTEMINVENETGTLPYEIWQYNTLTQLNHKAIANAVFLFYKPDQDMGAFRLLHSSVAGEVQNQAWRSYLYVNSQGGNNTNSRAEQYIGNK
jgi:GWxTD domain-containing protein